MNDLQGTPSGVLLWLLSGSGLATDNKLLVTNTSNLHGKASLTGTFSIILRNA
jgi:hypothetical protein